ncbi:hypothetical protein RND15_47440, partial [Streptomyces sp. DSM 41529]|nr:hypothetical protein [Streptomyces sp. DSM 41529]
MHAARLAGARGGPGAAGRRAAPATARGRPPEDPALPPAVRLAYALRGSRERVARVARRRGATPPPAPARNAGRPPPP